MTTTESGYSRRRRADRHLYPGRQAEEETDGGTARLTVFTTESVVDQSILTFNPSMVNLDIFLNAATSGMEDISASPSPAKSLEITYNTVLKPGHVEHPLSGRHPPGGPDRRPGLLDQAEETVMNRQTKQLLALAGVLAVGLGAYAALRVWNAGEEEREAAQADYVLPAQRCHRPLL